MTTEPLLQIDLPGIRKVKSGKVREIFDLGEALLLVATDRISAFDCIMPNGIPRKGEVLTQLSHFWFERFASLMSALPLIMMTFVPGESSRIPMRASTWFAGNVKPAS